MSRPFVICQPHEGYLLCNTASGDFAILDGELNVVQWYIPRLDLAERLVDRLLGKMNADMLDDEDPHDAAPEPPAD